MTEVNPSVKSEESKQEQNWWKSGVKLLGYVVPWWVVIVVLVLIAYILYDQGVFSKKNSNEMMSLPNSPIATGPSADVLAYQSTAAAASPQLRNLLGRLYY
jgi:hypothetical protein